MVMTPIPGGFALAYTAYARFLSPTKPRTETTVVEDADLSKVGQSDDASQANQNSQYKPDSGWFQVISLEYTATASVESGAGKSTGNIKETACKLVKNTGALTGITWRTHFTRAVFDIEVHLLDQKGGVTAEPVSVLKFKTAVFSQLRNFTGDPSLNSLASSVGASSTDTKELDELTFVYQAVEMNHHKKPVTLALLGDNK
jgi:hypothetical protein